MGRKKLPRTSPEEQTCKVCNKLKSRHEFTNDWRQPTGIDKVCKACVKVRSRESAIRGTKAWTAKLKLRRIEQPERHAQMLRERRRSKYHADFDAMWAEQDGKCAICSEPMLAVGNGPDAANMDYDRACCPTDKWACGRCVRGLIHKRCNLLLGHCHDSVVILEKTIVYLRAWQTRKRTPVQGKRLKRPLGVRAPQIREENVHHFRERSHSWFANGAMDVMLDRMVAEDRGLS